jgi:UDP-N-acetylmuramoyl-tripeptide--D-alanyl-D-alanine ligase
MRDWSAQRLAEAAGARSLAASTAIAGPSGVAIDSRAVRPGDLFVGVPGTQVDGGRFAPHALAAGAWGVLVAPEHADAARCAAPGVLLAADDPLSALQRLAREWRRELGCRVIGVTGSTGKTSTKDILAALLAPARRTVASRENLNTEVGLPLAILEAPAGTEVLVLELAMRGAGQIAELAAIARPDVGVIVNVGPVHLELLGTLEAVAAAKAELIAALPAGGVAVVPADGALLEPHLRPDVETVTFGDGGDVRLVGTDGDRVRVSAHGEVFELQPSFRQAHNRQNLLAAVAAAVAVDVIPEGEVEVAFSALRGERVEVPGGVVVINDCYNANPMSMRAALDDLAGHEAERRVAVLGDMLELGPDAREFHAQVGRHAREVGVELLLTVGELAAVMLEEFDGEAYAVADAGEAAAMLPELLSPGDIVLVKGSRGVRLETVTEALGATAEPAG